ncbi:MAG TPA: response regulator [Gammaproteobacteria bacterium]|nr:response regulator [Gammaproteobacteria bacterium]
MDVDNTGARNNLPRSTRARDGSESLIAEQPVVFVVDDDATVLRSIERLLRCHGLPVRPFASPGAFLRAIDPSTPGCVLLDLSLPGSTGLDVQTQLLASGNLQPIVFLSGYGTIRASVQAMKAGAVDFIEKPFEESTLIATVERAIERDREQRARRIEGEAYTARLELLTPRERQVLRHVIAGRLNKQIAARLGTAEKTIKVHRARVMYKMSVRSVAELTRVADFIGIQPEA